MIPTPCTLGVARGRPLGVRSAYPVTATDSEVGETPNRGITADRTSEHPQGEGGGQHTRASPTECPGFLVGGSLVQPTEGLPGISARTMEGLIRAGRSPLSVHSDTESTQTDPRVSSGDSA